MEKQKIFEKRNEEKSAVSDFGKLRQLHFTLHVDKTQALHQQWNILKTYGRYSNSLFFFFFNWKLNDMTPETEVYSLHYTSCQLYSYTYTKSTPSRFISSFNKLRRFFSSFIHFFSVFDKFPFSTYTYNRNHGKRLIKIYCSLCYSSLFC